MKFPKKQRQPKNRKKERGKRGTISRGAHREDQSELCLRVLSGSLFVLLLLSTILVCHTPGTLLSTIFVCHTPGTWNILDQQWERVLWTIIQHYFLLLTYVPNIHIILCVPSKLHKLFRSVQKRPLQSRYHCLIDITNQPPVVLPTACVGKNFVRAWKDASTCCEKWHHCNHVVNW